MVKNESLRTILKWTCLFLKYSFKFILSSMPIFAVIGRVRLDCAVDTMASYHNEVSWLSIEGGWLNILLIFKRFYIKTRTEIFFYPAIIIRFFLKEEVLIWNHHLLYWFNILQGAWNSLISQGILLITVTLVLLYSIRKNKIYII